MSERAGAGLPQLTGSALEAVRHRGSHLQIIASAGAGKTEVVSQRVVDLLADGVAPEAIAAFTFTARAAEELKNRIVQRVEGRLGNAALDRLNGLFVGTIHAFCFRLLQQRVPRYETYDVLDDNQLTAFLSREANRLELRQLDPGNRLYASIAAFLKAVDVVENELLDTDPLPDPVKSVLHNYYETLDRYRLLTYGQQVVRAVRELERPAFAADIHATLRHLIVDEYQDVNPAQERLIELLTGPQVELCVVGDDQQAIYQWRGSDVSNIVTFPQRYPDVATFEITANRRSRPQIIGVANRFAETIPERIDKQMLPKRPSADSPQSEVVVWTAETETEEAGWIVSYILDLVDDGVPLRDIAVLVRSRAAYPRLVEQFATFGIPVQPGGRSGLFDQPEAGVLGRTFVWLADTEWRGTFGTGQPVTDADLFDEYERVFNLSGPERRQLVRFLREWRAAVRRTNRTANLVGELYELFLELRVRSWDLTDEMAINRLGTLARFTSLLADYESVRRRARPDPDAPTEQVGGQDRGIWYYRNLALHIVNYAQGAYEGFDGEADFALDAVDLTTVHRAKGLEWPVVFVPSMTASRFPSSRTGQPQSWLVPRDQFDAVRYEGSDADERRLFYVAMTRARDWLSVSRHERVTTRRVARSPYHQEIGQVEVKPENVAFPPIESSGHGGEEPISMTYSQLAAFMDCGQAFRLRDLIGFQPRLATELGYGKAVHHVMRAVAEATKANGRVPNAGQIDEILNASFFLPTANKAAHRQLRDAARRLVLAYATQHEADLYRVWETERPFELHLDGVIIAGRADVILDKEGGITNALAIVDYKTSTSAGEADHALQLQVYADAARREGLDVRAAYVHDLKASARLPVLVDPKAVQRAEAAVTEAAARVKARDYKPNPGPRCRRCEVRTICGSAR
ncbi:ATP-dependent helicase [Micromonospora sp. NPDC048935]|uniref:ATP-dependent helicase n=1 Tax=Micromonospora sp. NPDC048935 TaxID=3364262 RepID=UPI0037182668